MLKALLCPFASSRFVVSPHESANAGHLNGDRTMLDNSFPLPCSWTSRNDQPGATGSIAMFGKKLLAIAGTLSCALAVSAANAQTTVAFIGGTNMYQWQNSGIFGGSAGYQWEADGFKVFGPTGPCVETNEALTALQGIIASGKKPLIHLMVGGADAATDDAHPVAEQLQAFETCFANLITTAQNANLKVVAGTNPFAQSNDIDPYNKFIFAYCTGKGIPVIDYQTLLVRANDNFEGTEYWIPSPIVIVLQGSGPAAGPPPSITSKGYAIMNALADRAIAQYVGGVTLKGGYLGNEYLEKNGAPPFVPGTGGNTVAPGTEMHWYAFGQYSDGITQPIANANILHEYGTWTSSNPQVISIDPYGTAWALAPGTASIHFTTLSGATINEWVMTVEAVPVP